MGIMDKNILRKEILERRNYLELDNKSKYDKVIFEKLINSDIYKKFRQDMEEKYDYEHMDEKTKDKFDKDIDQAYQQVMDKKDDTDDEMIDPKEREIIDEQQDLEDDVDRDNDDDDRCL